MDLAALVPSSAAAWQARTIPTPRLRSRLYDSNDHDDGRDDRGDDATGQRGATLPALDRKRRQETMMTAAGYVIRRRGDAHLAPRPPGLPLVRTVRGHSLSGNRGRSVPLRVCTLAQPPRIRLRESIWGRGWPIIRSQEAPRATPAWIPDRVPGEAAAALWRRMHIRLPRSK